MVLVGWTVIWLVTVRRMVSDVFVAVKVSVSVLRDVSITQTKALGPFTVSAGKMSCGKMSCTTSLESPAADSVPIIPSINKYPACLLGSV
jgi:hypothetical protein